MKSQFLIFQDQSPHPLEEKQFIDDAYRKVRELLTANEGKLRTLAKVLLEKETIEGEEIRRILELPEKKQEA